MRKLNCVIISMALVIMASCSNRSECEKGERKEDVVEFVISDEKGQGDKSTLLLKIIIKSRYGFESIYGLPVEYKTGENTFISTEQSGANQRTIRIDKKDGKYHILFSPPNIFMDPDQR